MKLTLNMKQENEILYVLNGRTYSYKGDVELLPESALNGLMGQRVIAHKRSANGGPRFTGWVRGALAVGVGAGYYTTVYLVENEINRRMYQSVNIKSVE